MEPNRISDNISTITENVRDYVNLRIDYLKLLLTEKIAAAPGIIPHQVHPEDRAVYWFYFFRMRAGAFRCGRSEFVRAIQAEGAGVSGGYIKVPLYGEPVFQQHAIGKLGKGIMQCEVGQFLVGLSE